MTMSFEEGIPLIKVLKDKGQTEFDLKEISKLINETFNFMIFKEGFVHSDPHPGNMLVRHAPDGSL